MFDDVTYLKLFVDPKVPWESIIKDLLTVKRLSKKELNRRIAFTVVNGERGLIQDFKGEMFLRAGNTFTQYENEDWTTIYDNMKKVDDVVSETRASLKDIHYMPVDEVEYDSRTFWVYNYLVKEWKLTPEAAAEEVCLYGATAIERMSSWYKNNWKKERGRYRFATAMSLWAFNSGVNLKTMKMGDLKTIYYES
jgi:hypothetical protein